ncbi:MAG TPA: phosphoribosylanthranilate isomerase [Terriglobia bacterium]|nr:phosphoribosylanthranilate isomerase [Terriglobia bacterium]
MTRVKICGIRRWEDAELAIELGASALGFNFYAFSKRFIAPERAADIIARLPLFIAPVGIFADETDAGRIVEMAQGSGVTTLQIHGARPSSLQELRKRFRLIRAVQIAAQFEDRIFKEMRPDAFLLDAYDPSLRGGTGKVFDWNLALEAKKYGPVILAGGLNPGNVGQAIRLVQPYAVDVASGVENSPGMKSHEKLKAFFNAVREADRMNPAN